jgi:hypothetical protein
MIFTLGFLVDTENVSQFPLSSKESIVECEKAVAHLKGGGERDHLPLGAFPKAAKDSNIYY